jgi:hypothetical protein
LPHFPHGVWVCGMQRRAGWGWGVLVATVPPWSVGVWHATAGGAVWGVLVATVPPSSVGVWHATAGGAVWGVLVATVPPWSVDLWHGTTSGADDQLRQAMVWVKAASDR